MNIETQMEHKIIKTEDTVISSVSNESLPL